ncbi:class I SAM-dependent methyltransferase [bacterium]|nr:MAG: class I SAM-dependent methyltransferase [bacterium]
MLDIFEIEISKSLDAKPELLPFIPELLADLWELGSSTDLVVELFRPLNLSPKTTRVLDLGCGKGAVSITLAHKLGFQVFGIDGFRPFLEEAKLKSKEHNVSDLCHFEYGDIRESIKKDEIFDIVIYAAIGDVLGGFNECVGKLRHTIRPGGYMLIDDGFLKESVKIEKERYGHYVSHGETVKQLTSFGDILLKEKVFTAEETRTMNKKYTVMIRQRAKKLANDHPELADSFFWYLRNQEEECEILETDVVGAVWLLQRKV